MFMALVDTSPAAAASSSGIADLHPERKVTRQLKRRHDEENHIQEVRRGSGSSWHRVVLMVWLQEDLDPETAALERQYEVGGPADATPRSACSSICVLRIRRSKQK
jgi:hypothetical protein